MKLTTEGNTKGYTRLSWDQYFMKIAFLVAERSTCKRHHVGAIAVRDHRILTTGYNGAPSDTKDCLELGCLRNELNIPSGERHEICRALHGEENAILQASLHGISIKGATIYCTHTPCVICAKMVAGSKISKFVYAIDYKDIEYKKLFKEVGIIYEKVSIPSFIISILK